MIGYTAGIAVSYGLSDFCGGRAARDWHPARVILASRCIVLPVLLVVAPLSGTASFAAFAWGAAAGVPLYLGFLGIFMALSTGVMTVAAPIIALTAAGVPLVVGVALGAPLSWIAWVSVVAAFLAGLLLTRGGDDDPDAVALRRRALYLAFGGGLCLGLFTVLTSRTDPATGFWPLLAAQLVALVIAVLVVCARPAVAKPAGRVVWPLLVASAAFELVGDGVALIAARENLALVGPALALQPATVIVLAWLIDRERISRVHAVGLASAGVALTLLAVAG